MTYSLRTDGDAIEMSAYDSLIKPHFPSYEVFWQKFVVPLSHRPGDKQLKTDSELAMIGKGHPELCIAQLHYTVLVQLHRAHLLMRGQNFSIDHLIFGLSSLVGAQDCAFELLERFENPGVYGPWLEKKRGGIPGGREAQTKWKEQNSFPLQDIRDYRNCLVHGRSPSGIVSTTHGVLTPKIGKETAYFDWRLVTAVSSLPISDFDRPSVIMKDAFDRSVAYFEATWKSELLPHL